MISGELILTVLLVFDLAVFIYAFIKMEASTISLTLMILSTFLMIGLAMIVQGYAGQNVEKIVINRTTVPIINGTLDYNATTANMTYITKTSRSFTTLSQLHYVLYAIALFQMAVTLLLLGIYITEHT